MRPAPRPGLDRVSGFGHARAIDARPRSPHARCSEGASGHDRKASFTQTAKAPVKSVLYAATDIAKSAVEVSWGRDHAVSLQHGVHRRPEVLPPSVSRACPRVSLVCDCMPLSPSHTKGPSSSPSSQASTDKLLESKAMVQSGLGIGKPRARLNPSPTAERVMRSVGSGPTGVWPLRMGPFESPDALIKPHCPVAGKEKGEGVF